MSSNTTHGYATVMSGNHKDSQPDQEPARTFSMLLENSSDIFFISPFHGNKLTFISKNAGTILGYSTEELLQMPASAIVLPDSLKKLCNAIDYALASDHTGDEVIRLSPQPIELLKNDTSVLQAEIYCSLQMSKEHKVIDINGIVKPNIATEASASTNAGVSSVAPSAEKKTSTPRKGKILIMDDEDILIDIAVQMGKRIGLIVETSKNGSDAIEKYRSALAKGEPHDAILLDMTIAGGMGGLEAAQELQKIDPNVKKIVMSGYSDHEVMAKPDKYGFVAVISKPFRLNEFGRVLKEVIPAEKFIT